MSIEFAAYVSTGHAICQDLLIEICGGYPSLHLTPFQLEMTFLLLRPGSLAFAANHRPLPAGRKYHERGLDVLLAAGQRGASVARFRNGLSLPRRASPDVGREPGSFARLCELCAAYLIANRAILARARPGVGQLELFLQTCWADCANIFRSADGWLPVALISHNLKYTSMTAAYPLYA